MTASFDRPRLVGVGPGVAGVADLADPNALAASPVAPTEQVATTRHTGSFSTADAIVKTHGNRKKMARMRRCSHVLDG